MCYAFKTTSVHITKEGNIVNVDIDEDATDQSPMELVSKELRQSPSRMSPIPGWEFTPDESHYSAGNTMMDTWACQIIGVDAYISDLEQHLVPLALRGAVMFYILPGKYIVEVRTRAGEVTSYQFQRDVHDFARPYIKVRNSQVFPCIWRANKPLCGHGESPYFAYFTEVYPAEQQGSSLQNGSQIPSYSDSKHILYFVLHGPDCIGGIHEQLRYFFLKQRPRPLQFFANVPDDQVPDNFDSNGWEGGLAAKIEILKDRAASGHRLRVKHLYVVPEQLVQLWNASIFSRVQDKRMYEPKH